MTAVPKLTPAQQRFVLHWGEMGTRWGINRTVAQIHALLFLAPEPLNAEDISVTLDAARSNVSTSLKELQGWGLIRVVHLIGDKRDHFESLKDVWEMFRVIADTRKRREIDPTRHLLQEILAEPKELDPYTRERLQSLGEFFEVTGTWYGQISRWPRNVLLRFLTIGDKALKLMGGG
jgi:DNA-binding transcriptional regulator GbsR (MarR family)